MKGKPDSFHSAGENILNSSIFSGDEIEILSRIEEEEKESEMFRSKIADASPVNTKSIQFSKFFMQPHPQNISNFSQNLEIAQDNSEIIETTLILDSKEIFPIHSQLPPIIFQKGISNDLSIIASDKEKRSFSNDNEDDDEEEISLNFLINQMNKQINQSESEAGSFNLNDYLDENKSQDNDFENKDQAILEISSFIIKSEGSSLEILVREKISWKQKCYHFFKYVFTKRFFRRKEVKTFVLFYISLFNSFYVPLNMIFNHYDYPPVFIAVELLNTLYLGYLFVKKTIKYFRALKRSKSKISDNSTPNKLTRDDENAIIILLKTKTEIYFTLFYDFLYVIPFPLIIEKVGLSHGKFYLFNIFRLTNVKYITRGIHYLKEKASLFGSIIQILILSIIFTHLFACILIAIAKTQEDFNQSFLRRLPSPQFSTFKGIRTSLDIGDSAIYVQALYWVYATISKSGVMEMQVVNIWERVFSIIVMSIGGLFYIFVFSNMVSLVEDLTPKMKSILEKQEKKVLKYVRHLNLKGLEKKVESYFTHFWKSDKGFNENELLNSLPPAIKVDIQKCQYLPIFKKSQFFSHGKLIPRPDSSLIYSLFKFLQSEIFIPNDLIIIAGDFCNKVYFILEGRVELISFDLKTKIILQSGDFFGGIINLERQPGYAKALTFCKIGHLDAETFEMMKERFPLWNEKMSKQMMKHKTTLLRDLSFYSEENNLGMLDSVNLQGKVIDEKIIEHYYPTYLGIEKEIHGENKSDKIIKKELEKITISKNPNSVSNRNETKEAFLSPPPPNSKRQNIVHLMNQSIFN